MTPPALSTRYLPDRCVVWKELGEVGLLSLLDPPRSTASACDRRSRVGGYGPGGALCHARLYLYPADHDTSIIDAYLTALEHPRFGRTESEPASPGINVADDEAGVSDDSKGDEPGEHMRVGTGGVSGDGVVEVEPTMRSVAVHHLAGYFFARHPPGGGGPRREDGANGVAESGALGKGTSKDPAVDEELPPGWKPDFGQRKRFERLLRMARVEASGGGPGLVPCAASSVIGYFGPCSGGRAGPSQGDDCRRRGESEGAGAAGSSKASSLEPPRGCRWVRVLPEGRRRYLQLYADALGLGEPGAGKTECLRVGKLTVQDALIALMSSA